MKKVTSLIAAASIALSLAPALASATNLDASITKTERQVETRRSIKKESARTLRKMVKMKKKMNVCQGEKDTEKKMCLFKIQSMKRLQIIEAQSMRRASSSSMSSAMSSSMSSAQ